jgi:hypothetical protein
MPRAHRDLAEFVAAGAGACQPGTLRVTPTLSGTFMDRSTRLDPRFATLVLLVSIALLAAVGLAGCKQRYSNYCCEDGDCGSVGIVRCETGETCGPEHRCIEGSTDRCESMADCLDPVKKQCSPEGVCVACIEGSCTPELPVCDVGGTDSCGMCESEDDCIAHRPANGHCDTTSGECVGCRPGEAGAGDCDPASTTPICSGAACRGCQTHDECPSKVCVLDDGDDDHGEGEGRCVPEADIIYVARAGTDATCTSCTRGAACQTVSCALSKVDPRRIIRILDTGPYMEGATLVIDEPLRLVADSAQLGLSVINAPLFDVRGSVNVEIEGVTTSVFGNDPASTHAVLCMNVAGTAAVTLRRVKLLNSPGAGIQATNCNLVVRDSTIAGNDRGGVVVLQDGRVDISGSTVSGNEGGGLSLIDTSFAIRNNFIVGNGGAATQLGGVRISGALAGSALEFNTISRNQSSVTFSSGVRCDTVASNVRINSNIVAHNSPSPTKVQVDSAGCDVAYTLSNDNLAALGASNRQTAMLPGQLFVDPDAGNFHSLPGSLAVDNADPAATLAVDVDGEMRPLRTGRDIGADEVP